MFLISANKRFHSFIHSFIETEEVHDNCKKTHTLPVVSDIAVHLRQLEYLKRLDKLNLRTLRERRNRADLREVFKMLNGLIDIALNTFFERNTAT